MNLYFIIIILCGCGPIVAWTLYSLDSIKKKIAFLCILTIVIILGYFALPPLITLCSSQIVWKGNVIHDPYVGGSIDSALINKHSVVSLSAGLQVSPGDTIFLSGWMKSNLNEGAPPKVVLLSTNMAIQGGVFTTTLQFRPDVAKHENDPELLQSGFSASLQVPTNQPLGEYYLQVIRSDKKSSQVYLPYIAFRVTLPIVAQNDTAKVLIATKQSTDKKKKHKADLKSNP